MYYGIPDSIKNTFLIASEVQKTDQEVQKTDTLNNTLKKEVKLLNSSPKNIFTGQRSSGTYTARHNQHSVNQMKNLNENKVIKSKIILFLENINQLSDRSGQVQPQYHQNPGSHESGAVYRRNKINHSGNKSSAVPNGLLNSMHRNNRHYSAPKTTWSEQKSKQKLPGLEHLKAKAEIKHEANIKNNKGLR